MKDSEIICEIKWSVADIRAAFVKQFDHEPTEEQLEVYVNKLDTRALQDISIERGWEFIFDTIFLGENYGI